MSSRILIVDDEETIRKLLQTRLLREGFEVEIAVDGSKAFEMALARVPTAIITDIKMPGLDGFQLIEALKAKEIDCPVIVITGHGEKECAIEAIHKGAFDYLEKPFNMDDLAATVKRAVESEELKRNNGKLLVELEVANKKLSTQLEVKSELLDRVTHTDTEDDGLIGKSIHIQRLKEMIHAVAENFRGDHDPAILIIGESGVGKEVFARYIHNKTFVNKDTRGKQPAFVAINCAAFPDTLLESELFGYEKGAFTGANSRKLGLFELATDGTLFLDEIGEMDLKMQAKLLRAVQERTIRRLGGTVDIPVHPHIIAATNRDLAKAVADKVFREDLYYRLNTIPITVPPLRSRVEDVDLLATYFLKLLSKGRGKKFSGFSNAALKAMEIYNWPGNVRELRSVIERAVILEKGPIIELSQLRQESMRSLSANGNGGEVLSMGTSFKNSTTVHSPSTTASINFPLVFEKGLTQLRKEMDEHFVRDVLIQVLTKDKGNVSAVARALKLDRANLLRMLKRYGIEPDAFRLKEHQHDEKKAA